MSYALPAVSYELSRAQRAKLSAGECPGITGEGPCPVSKGEVIEVKGEALTLRVVGIERTVDTWKLRYEVTDRREDIRLLRRTPPVVPPRGEFDEPDAEAVKRAARESSYTSSSAAAVSDAGEAVDEATQKRFTKEADDSFRVHLERERRERASRSLDQRLRAVQDLAARKGIDLTRKLTSIEKRIESAERDVGRDGA